MDLRQLTYFQTVCKYKSFTKTAEKANVSQPSITVAIRKLEDELGVTLLERDRKRVLITPAGEIFLQRVNGILNAVENVTAEMKDYSKLKKEEIRIGIPPMIGSYLLPQMFTEYRVEHPNVELIIHELGSTEIQKQIAAKELDLGLIVLRENSPLFEVEQLKDEEILLVMAEKHRLSKFTEIPFEHLEKEPFILMKKGTNIRALIMETCAKYGFEPNVVHTSTQIATVTKLVAAGIGVSFMPDIMAKQYTNFVSKSFSTPLFIKTGLIWSKDKYLTASIKELVQFIKTKSDVHK